ncbi:hypothetical protein PAPHI01_0067 [Pancytospora philotis]|nr:hypothetical protein PAPHI01_0067 [Pancytospora philotis]
MLAWLAWQLPICYASKKAPQKLNVPVYTCADYTGFGNAGVAALSALEVKMLTPLCQYCIKHDNPEAKPAVDDARLDRIAAVDKIRMVLRSVLYRHARDPHFLAQQAGAFDYAAHKLLLKLFGDDFIKAFMAGPVQGSLELYHILAELIDKHQHTVEDIRRILSSMMPRWNTVELAQYIERNRATSKNGHDLMIWLFGIELHRNTSLATFFERLMGLWPDDADRLDKLMPVASEFVRIAHSPPSMFERHKILFLERAIVNYVVTENQQACEVLFKASSNHNIITPLVNEHIEVMKREKKLDNEFLLRYARYVRKEHSYADDSLYRLFKHILSPTHAFHSDENAPWNSERRYFNSISYAKLREVFTELHENPDDPDQQKRMETYMEMLDYDAFLNILKSLADPKRTPLANFMALHMNEKRKEEYKCGLRQSRSKKYGSRTIGVLNTIENALSSPRPSIAQSSAVVGKK